jgi:predicted metal-dependent hydrolase
VQFKRSRRARCLRLAVQPFQPVSLTLPRKAAMAEARAFVLSKQNWIARQRERIRLLEHRHRQFFDRQPPLDRPAAEQRLKRRLKTLADRFGFAYTGVTVRNQRTRWGSCSACNRISLNVKLVLLPKELMDYVLLHELVHTRQKHHGPEFWRELQTLMADVGDLRARLNAHAFLLL